MVDLPQDLALQVEPELESGETLLWVGRPRTGRFLLRSLPIFGFGVIWTAFSSTFLFMFDNAPEPPGGGPQVMFTLMPLLFVGIGICMLLSPLWSLYKAGRTVYAITDRRAVLREQGFSMSVRSFTPDRLMDLQRRERSDGSGDIVFDRRVHRDSEGSRHTTEIGFFGIENVREVERLLRQIAESRV